MTPQTTPQHLRALDVANERRIARAKWKRQVRTARTFEAALTVIADTLDDPPAHLTSMGMLALLKTVPGMYERTALGLLREAGIVSPLRTVGELTVRQRRALAGAVRAWRDRPQARRARRRRAA